MTRPRFDRLDGKFPRNSSLFSPSVCLSAANLRRFSSADSATGGADFKRPSKREVLSLHRRNLREISLTYCIDGKKPKKSSLLEGAGTA